MKGQKGMWTDGEPHQNPQDTTRDNKNVVLTESYGAFTNEPGFELYINDNVTGRKPIGIIKLANNDFILFSIWYTQYSEIGYVSNTGEYSVIISEYNRDTAQDTLHKIGFNKHYPVTGEYQINFKGERIITFTDGKNSPKILNIDDLPNVFNELTGSLFNPCKTPTISSNINEGGSFNTGAYYPIIALVRKDGSISNYFHNYLPVYITDDSVNTTYNKLDGAPANTLTSKSIMFEISNIDTDYDKIRVGFIQQVENVKTAFVSNDLLIEPGVMKVNITSNSTLLPVDLSEVLVDKAFYDTAKNITQENNILYLGDLSKTIEPNQQSAVNNIYLHWSSEKINVLNNKVGYKYNDYNNKKRHFQHGEVYAFYIRFEYIKGWGRQYVLNGRLAEPTERDIVTIDGTNWKKYQVEETATVINDDGNKKTGHFGFWENEDEVYPTTGNFPVGRVRHFKFPSLNYIKNIDTDVMYGTHIIDVLGIIVNNLNLANIKDCDGNSAISYSISYAKRDGRNNTVYGQSPVIYKKGYNVEHDVEFKGSNEYSVRSTTPRVYPFEMLHAKTAISATHYRKEYKLLTGVQKGIFGNSLGDNSNDALNVCRAIDYINENFISAGGNTLNFPTQRACYKIPYNINKCNLTYIPNNVMTTTVNNLYCEEFIELNDKAEDIPTELINTSTTQDIEYTYLVSLIALKRNVYEGFSMQETVSMGIFKTVTTEPLFGGDTYISDYCFNTLSPAYDEYTTDVSVTNKNHKLRGTRVARRLLVESVYNINLRHSSQSTLNGYTFYYPKTSWGYLASFELDKNVNLFNISYNTDYNAVLDINYAPIWNGIKKEISKNPFRIIRSKEFNKLTDVNTWRDFKVNDYYEIPKNKGKIINLVSGKDFIYIHTEKTLFRTKGRNIAQQSTDAQDNLMYIGVGDIFAFPAFEIIHSDLGELGTQHKFSCTLTKFGYIFYDSEKGKWFLISDDIKEISSNGKYNFFMNNKECYGDNPYNGDGIMSVYDDKFKRFLVTRKFKDLKDTSSFKGVYKENELFKSSLKTGDIVYNNGFKIIT